MDGFLRREMEDYASIVLCGFSGGIIALEQDTTIFTIKNEYHLQSFTRLGSSLDCAANLAIFTNSSLESFASSDRLLGAEEKRELAGAFPQCQFVEMEFFPLWQWSERTDRTVQMVRVLSDTIAQDLPLPAGCWLDPKTGQPSTARIILGLLREPTRLGRFGRFVRRVHSARDRLARHLILNYA